MIDRESIYRYFTNEVKDEQLYRHSTRVAQVAYDIAKNLEIDENKIYCYGLLHDIGKTANCKGISHTYNGYLKLKKDKIIDYPQICLTHSFPYQKVESYMGKVDCAPNEYDFLKNYIENCKYNLSDRIIQLADAIAGADGCMILEISMIKVAFKYQMNNYTIDSWKAYFQVYNEIEKLLHKNVYSVLTEDVQGYSKIKYNDM